MKSVKFNGALWHLFDNGNVENSGGIVFNLCTNESNIPLEHLPKGLFSHMESVFNKGKECYECLHDNHFSTDECVNCGTVI